MKYLLFLLLISCGTDDGENKAEPTAESPALKENENEFTPDNSMVSIAVADFSMLKACDESLQNQLAYVKNENQFYVCDGDWTKIEINGEKGEKGEKGTPGDATKVLDSNLWVDEITGLTWLIGGVGNHDTAVATCVNKYRLPSAQEGLAAMQNGIRAAATIKGAVSLDFWGTQTYVDGGADLFIVNGGNIPVVSSTLRTNGKAIFCVKI